MSWPINHLLVVLVVAMSAIVFPWIMPRTWRKFVIVPVTVPIATTLVWLQYEQHLDFIARSGDPLIRLDLFLILPLISLDWLSATVAIALTHLRNPSATQGLD
jgi:hypothetical protein